MQDAWGLLRRLYTATAVTFESQLRPEFLGHQDKHTMVAVSKPAIDCNDDDNDVDVLLQLPPNITVPDATALAVLYEHLYNGDDYDNDLVSDGISDYNRKEEKNFRSSSLVTSPLLLLPSPWLSSNSGISCGLGALMDSDYGLQVLHVLCTQYSKWVQQKDKNLSEVLTKPPVVQLDRFRSNFRTLLRQYSDDSSAYSDEDYVSHEKEPTYSHYNGFTYEKYYEDQVEKYGIGGEVCDECDNDDDDATVICCNNNNLTMPIANTAATTLSENMANKTMLKGVQCQIMSKDYCLHNFQVAKHREENHYIRWIKDINLYNKKPAPLDYVFCTELHVYLFWPPTVLLLDSLDQNDEQPSVPSYALGTTYGVKAAATHIRRSKEYSKHYYQNHKDITSLFGKLITTQLDRASQDMRLRYRAMDKFLDGACTYSIIASKLAYPK